MAPALTQADTASPTAEPGANARRRKRLLGVLFSALILGLLAVIGWVTYVWNRESAITDLQLVAQHKIERLRQSLSTPTSRYGYLPAMMASHPALRAALAHPDEAQRVNAANDFLEELHRESGVGVGYLLDADGRVIAASNWREPGSFVGKNFRFRPYFIEAMRIGDGHFYGMGVVSLTPGYYLSRAVKEGGRNVGVAVVKVDISNLDDDWRQDTSETTVSDENGVIFLSSRPTWKYRPMRPLGQDTIARLKRTRQYEAVLRAPMQIRRVRSLGEDESLVKILPVPGESLTPGASPRTWFLRSAELSGSPWTVSVYLPMDDVEASARRDAVFSATVAGFLILALFSIVQLLTRNAERESARRALSRAHQALEARHRDLQKLTEELRVASITDPLTGAYNRRYFNEAAARMVSAARRHGEPLSVVLIDADHFKHINDGYGHAAGDLALQALSEVCRSGLREEDLFARLGGEEFVALLPGTGAEAAAQVAERLRCAVEERVIPLADKTLALSISSGVAQWRPQEPTIEDAVGRADRAVYVAKREGRNRVVTA